MATPALGIYDYLELLETKAAIGANLGAGVTTDDVALVRMIQAAEDVIQRRIGRSVVRRTYVDVYDGDGTDEILLFNPPASVTRVCVDEDRVFPSSDDLVANTDYVVPEYNEGATAGSGRSIVLVDQTALEGFPDSPQSIHVEYQGGWTYTVDRTDPQNPNVTADQVPPAIRRATLLTVQRLHQLSGDGKARLGSPSAAWPGGGSTTAVRGDADIDALIPLEASELLKLYLWPSHLWR